MPAVIIAIIGAALSVIMLPIMFAMSVWAPMIMGNTFYLIYTYTGGAQLTKLFFGTSASAGNFNFTIDWSNPYMQFLIVMLLMGIIGFSIFCGLKAVVTYTKFGKTHSLSFGRLAYGVIGIIGVPVIFTIGLSLANLMFGLFSPNTLRAFIETKKIQDIQGMINNQLLSISNIIGQPLSWESSTDLADSIQKLITKLNTIATDATQSGNTNLASACNNVITDLGTLQPMLSAQWWNTIHDQFNAAFNNNAWASGGSARAPDDWWNNFLTPYNNLFAFQSAWNNMWKDMNDLTNNYTQVSGMSDIINWMNIIKPNTITPDSIFYFFSDWTQTGQTWTHLSIINQMIQGAQNPDTGKIADSTVSLNYLFNCANPTAEFVLFVQIFQYTTGSSSSNWKDFWIYYGAGFELWRMPAMVMGATCVVILTGALYNYGWFMIKRIIDLAILWAASIWFGFTDMNDGIQFRSCQKLIWQKLLSIVVIQAVFELCIIVMNMHFFADITSGTNDVYTSGAVLTATSMIFGAAYYGADMLNGLMWGEAGTFRGIADQMGVIRSQGQGVQGNARSGAQQGTSGVSSVVGESGKVAGTGFESRMRTRSFKSQNETNSLLRGLKGGGGK